jgi:exosortase A-associated hydrolase 2
LTDPANYSLSTDFLECEGRQLFTVLLQPEGAAVIGSILFLPPFAQEMHKSRRTVAQQARAMAAAGYNVMLLDLSGSGDSSGSFADASWSAWKEDAQCAVAALRARATGPVILWGLRFGALLACDLAQEQPDIDQLLLWQPALNGEQYIDQFLRFELAGQALKGESGFDRAGLWNELRAGRSLEVAGYELSSRLGIEIAHVRLGDMKPGCPVTWIDVTQPAIERPTVPGKTVIDRWLEQGVPVVWKSAEGEPFWRNVDAPDSPALLRDTLKLLGPSQ